MSGYDVFSLIFISCMRLHWNVLRHPLFVAVLLPLYWVNHWLMPSTEFNFAIFLMAIVLVACDVWGAVLLHRILRDIVGCTRVDATLLTVLFYGFAHIMITVMVPDHFALSLPLLLLTLLLMGRKLQQGKRFTYLQQALLFMLTAGITLTKGIKRIEAAVKKKDPGRVEKLKVHDDFVKQQNGKALVEKVPLLEWSDITTPRLQSVVDNLFGESLQLHRDYLLEDVQQTRPVFVGYRWIINYVAEAVVLLLLLAGAWIARRSKFFWVVASWFGFDMLMHIGFGFGINEVYIMTAHWAFIIPIAIGYLLCHTRSILLRFAVASLAVWMWVYNATIIGGYLL